MFAHPKCRLDEPEFSVAFSSECIGGVALAMKNNNACIVRDLWRRPIVGGPIGDAVVFETRTPFRGPVSQLALPM